MRSLIIVEVEHGDTTDPLDGFIKVIHNLPVLMTPNVSILDYTVKVDLPECFTL